MRKLAAAPAEAVRLIRGDIRAVPKVSDGSLRRIFLDLDADEFKVRRQRVRLWTVSVPFAWRG